MDFKRKTKGFRHWLVRQIAPKTFADAMSFTDINISISHIPRPMVLFLKEYFKSGNKLTCAEIGVLEGQNALNMFLQLRISKMFLIDPYSLYIEDGAQDCYQEVEQIAKMNLSDFNGLVELAWIKKTSEDAVKDVTVPLDFVYIDGNHSYEYVKKDIELYYPLVKSSGLIGGHDYVPFRWKGLVKAVNEFADKHGRLHFYAVYPDWWFIKP